MLLQQNVVSQTDIVALIYKIRLVLGRKGGFGRITTITQKQVTNVYEHCPSPRVYHVVIIDLKFGYARI
jgi:hypothetical protein